MSVVRTGNVISYRIPIRTGWADSDGHTCHKNTLSVFDYHVKKNLPSKWTIHVDLPSASTADLEKYLTEHEVHVMAIKNYKELDFKLVPINDLFDSITVDDCLWDIESFGRIDSERYWHFLVSFPKCN